MPKKDKVLVGEITSAHGIRGMVKIYPLTDTPERFKTIPRLYIEGEDILREVETASVQKNMVLLKIKGINSRNESEAICKKKVYIPFEDRKPLEKDQYFIDDLIGLSVYTVSGEQIGELRDMMTQHGNDILVIATPGEDILIPFVKAFVRSISKERIVVDPIEGMLP
ncbi:MAG: ribosome maturation factor RimM [Peptoniphilus sp.]|nr:ribosome maturation factor RimM [Peptoniphilus sp.]MDY3119206.1 ribosome maturation factor RimM [Peptoniphilus sp.]